MRWRPYTEQPNGAEIAAIAVPCLVDGSPFLLPELYRFDVAEGRWLGARCALPLRQSVFAWLPESELLQAAPISFRP